MSNFVSLGPMNNQFFLAKSTYVIRFCGKAGSLELVHASGSTVYTVPGTGTLQINTGTLVGSNNNYLHNLYVNIAYCIYSILYSKHVDATTI